MNVRSNPDYAPITLRRIELMQGRLEAIYMSLYLSILLIFLALMGALYIVRKDILKAVDK
jgi:hypothetical protein